MKIKWLNLILLLTNRIYSKKQKLLSGLGLRVISEIFSLILLELILSIVSLPLYFGTKTSGVLAFFAEKGGYEKISSDYKLRRVLTLSGVSIIFVIWFIKLLLIVLPPVAYGPLQLYSVTDLSPVEIDRQELVLQDTGIQTAKVVSSLQIPKIEMVEKIEANKYLIYGTGIPGQTTVLFLVEDKTLMYTSIVDNEGKWKIEHSQGDYKLKEGIHSVFVFAYNKDVGIRSNSSVEQYFRIKDSPLQNISENIDSVTNWTIAIFISIGVFLTFLTI